MVPEIQTEGKDTDINNDTAKSSTESQNTDLSAAEEASLRKAFKEYEKKVLERIQSEPIRLVSPLSTSLTSTDSAEKESAAQIQPPLEKDTNAQRAAAAPKKTSVRRASRTRTKRKIVELASKMYIPDYSVLFSNDEPHIFRPLGQK